MSRDLHAECVAYLRKHGPTTAGDLALAVRARRTDVDTVLTQQPFSWTETIQAATPGRGISACPGLSQRRSGPVPGRR